MTQKQFRTVRDKLTSWQIPLWDNTGHILVTVHRERVFDVGATVPLSLSIDQKRVQKKRGKLSSCKFRLRIDIINTQDSEPKLEDTLLQIGWLESTAMPILPWMEIVDAIATMQPAFKNTTAAVSQALEEMQSSFEKLE